MDSLKLCYRSEYPLEIFLVVIALTIFQQALSLAKEIRHQRGSRLLRCASTENENNVAHCAGRIARLTVQVEEQNSCRAGIVGPELSARNYPWFAGGIPSAALELHSLI